MKKYFLIPMIFILLVSCISNPSKKYDKKYKAKEDISFPNWKEYPKINYEIFESDSHDAFVDIYINKLGRQAYIDKMDKFPVGSKIFKPLYRDKKRKKLVKLVIMVKREKGYDKENGDWWYGVYDETGKEAWYQGKIQSCIKCHTIAKETDYLFTESVMDVIDMQTVAEI